MDERTLAEARRSAATRAIVKYVLLGCFVVATVSTLLVFAVYEAGQRKADRTELCVQLETLKTQNREDIAEEKKHYKRNLRLLGLKDTPELRSVVEKRWAKALSRNARKSCPYT